MSGSLCSHGDQAIHRWRSFTNGKITPGGAPTFADRATRNTDGRMATMTANTSTRTASRMMILISMCGGSSQFAGTTYAEAGAALATHRPGPASLLRPAARLLLFPQLFQVRVEP